MVFVTIEYSLNNGLCLDGKTCARLKSLLTRTHKSCQYKLCMTSNALLLLFNKLLVYFLGIGASGFHRRGYILCFAIITTWFTRVRRFDSHTLKELFFSDQIMPLIKNKKCCKLINFEFPAFCNLRWMCTPVQNTGWTMNRVVTSFYIVYTPVKQRILSRNHW